MRTLLSFCSAEVELAVVESSDTSISGVTDEEPPVWSAAARDGLVDTSPPAQQQLKPVQRIPPRLGQHSSGSSRPPPQPAANGAAVNGHQGGLHGSALPSAAPAAALRDGRAASQRSDLLSLDDKDQPEPSHLQMPVAVRMLLHHYVSFMCLLLPLTHKTGISGMARRWL